MFAGTRRAPTNHAFRAALPPAVYARAGFIASLSSAPARPIPIRAAWSYHAEQFGPAGHCADMQLGQLEHQPVARAPGSRSAASRTVTSVRRMRLGKAVRRMRRILRHGGSAIPTAFVHRLAGGTLSGSTDDGLSGPAKSTSRIARTAAPAVRRNKVRSQRISSIGRRIKPCQTGRDSPDNPAIVDSEVGDPG